MRGRTTIRLSLGGLTAGLWMSAMMSTGIAAPEPDAKAEPSKAADESSKEERHRVFERKRLAAKAELSELIEGRSHAPALAKDVRPLELHGRVELLDDGRVLISRAMKPEEEPGLKRMGYTWLSAGQPKRNRSVFKDRVYESFAVDRAKVSAKRLDRELGQEVKLTLRQKQKGGWVIVGVDDP